MHAHAHVYTHTHTNITNKSNFKKTGAHQPQQGCERFKGNTIIVYWIASYSLNGVLAICCGIYYKEFVAIFMDYVKSMITFVAITQPCIFSNKYCRVSYF